MLVTDPSPARTDRTAGVVAGVVVAAAASPAAPTGRGSHRLERTARWRALAPLVIAVVPLVVPAVAMVASPPHINWAGDQALTELAVRQAVGAHQLLGMGGRFGWRHPGPLWIYLLAPVYELAGRGPWSLGLAVLGLHIAMVTAGVAAAGRAGGRRAALVVAALVVLYIQATGLAYWTNLWAGYAFTWPMLALVMVAAVATTTPRAGWALPAAALLATLLVQTDVSTIVPVAAVGLAAAVLRARRVGLRHLLAGRRGTHTAGGAAVPVATVGLLAALAVAWVPPVIEQLTAHPGNITLLYHFGRQGAGGYPVRTALAAVGAALTVFPFGARWVLRNGMQSHIASGPWWAVTVAVAFMAGTLATALVARRRRRRLAGDLALLSLVGAIAAVIAVSRVAGEINFYLLTWITVLPIPALTGLVLTVAPSPGRRATVDPLASVALAVAAAVALVVVVTQGTTNNWDRATSALVADQTRLVQGAVGATGGSTVDIHVVTADTWRDAAGVALQLQRRGARIEVDRSWVFLFGDAFTPRGAPPAVELWFARTHELPVLADQADLVDLGATGASGDLGASGDIHVLVRRNRPA